MTKVQKPFEFTFLATKRIVRDLKFITETLPLTVKGVGYFNSSFSVLDIYNRFTVDIEEISGAPVLTVLEWEIDITAIEEAAIRHIAGLFEQRRAA